MGVFHSAAIGQVVSVELDNDEVKAVCEVLSVFIGSSKTMIINICCRR